MLPEVDTTQLEEIFDNRKAHLIDGLERLGLQCEGVIGGDESDDEFGKIQGK